MILAISAENSSIEFGVFKKDELILKRTISAQSDLTSFEYVILIDSILKFSEIDLKSISNSIVSSVVPKLEKSLSEAINILIGRKPIVVGKGVKTGLDVKLAGASMVGTDFVCNCVGCLNKGKLPAMIADIGYVTTISVLDKNGAFVGRTIHAGGSLQLESLGEKTALLPTLSMAKPERILGKTTEESLSIGAAYSCAATVEFMYKKLSKEYENINVFVTGSESEYIKDLLGFDYMYDTDLALQGLAAILKKNS